MSKYQKALDTLRMFANEAEYSEDMVALNDNRYLLLRELVDKATPKKPNLIGFTNHDIYYSAYACKTCKNAVTDDDDTENVPSYCEHCGQALDWSE
jgi:hypothetical protein